MAMQYQEQQEAVKAEKMHWPLNVSFLILQRGEAFFKKACKIIIRG